MTLSGIKRPTYCVLVTGAGGLIGRRLVPALVADGHSVVLCGNNVPPYLEHCAQHVFSGHWKGSHVIDSAVKTVVQSKSQIPAAIHLAAIGSTAFDSPEAIFRENVERTHHLLDACRRSGLRRFVFTSTGLVYGNRCRVPFTEDSLPAPASLYASSKLAAEALVGGYAKEYDFSSDILRLSNVYGPDSPPSTIVGKLLSCLRGGSAIKVESFSPVRDFVYVEDVITGMIKLLNRGGPDGCRIVNLSTGIGVSIAELVQTALSAAGQHFAIENCEGSEDCNILANERLIERTGWGPTYSLEEGLKATLSFSAQL